MLQALYESDNPDLMKRIWAFRHRRFVEDIGWRELARDDGLERDQFDTSTALHLVLEKNNDVIGYSRLLQTTGPHLVKHFLPGNAALPIGPNIYEWSRCAIAREAQPFGRIPAGEVLMTGVLECLLALGAEAISFLSYPSVTRMMHRKGYPVRVIAEIAVESGRNIQAVFSPLPVGLLAHRQQAAGINCSLVTWGQRDTPTGARQIRAA